jgi:hypothetical protein
MDGYKGPVEILDQLEVVVVTVNAQFWRPWQGNGSKEGQWGGVLEHHPQSLLEHHLQSLEVLALTAGFRHAIASSEPVKVTIRVPGLGAAKATIKGLTVVASGPSPFADTQTTRTRLSATFLRKGVSYA